MWPLRIGFDGANTFTAINKTRLNTRVIVWEGCYLGNVHYRTNKNTFSNLRALADKKRECIWS